MFKKTAGRIHTIEMDKYNIDKYTINTILKATSTVEINVYIIT